MTARDPLDAFESRLHAADYIGAVRWLRAHPAAIQATRHLRVAIGDASVSLEELRDLLSLKTDADAVHSLAAAVWAQDGSELNALHIFEAAARAGSTVAARDYGEALHWFGSYDSARPWLERALGSPSTETAWVHGLLGEVYLARGQMPEAVSHLRRGAEEHAAFGVPLAKALVASGRPSEAKQLLMKLVDAGQYGAAIRLGNLLDAEDDQAGAERAYRAGIDTADAHSAYNLALLYMKQGRKNAAREAFRLARSLGDHWAPPDEPSDAATVCD